jgi:NADH:ubiquinone oxidoreductase subunit 3 (subunit A)
MLLLLLLMLLLLLLLMLMLMLMLKLLLQQQRHQQQDKCAADCCGRDGWRTGKSSFFPLPSPSSALTTTLWLLVLRPCCQCC